MSATHATYSYALKSASPGQNLRQGKALKTASAAKPPCRAATVEIKCEQKQSVSRRAFAAALPLLAGVQIARPASAGLLGPDPYCDEERYYDRTGKLVAAMQRLVSGTSEDIAADLAFFREESVAWAAEYRLAHLSKTTGRYVFGFDNTFKAITGITGTANWCEGAEACVTKPYDSEHTLYNKDYMIGLLETCAESVAKGNKLLGKA